MIPLSRLAGFYFKSNKVSSVEGHRQICLTPHLRYAFTHTLLYEGCFFLIVNVKETTVTLTIYLIVLFSIYPQCVWLVKKIGCNFSYLAGKNALSCSLTDEPVQVDYGTRHDIHV